MSRSLRPLLATAVIFAIAYALAVMQFPSMFSTRVLGNFLTQISGRTAPAPRSRGLFKRLFG